MSILVAEPPPIAAQYVVGFQNAVDRAAGVTIGATTALTSLGLLIFPSRTFQSDAQELVAICHGRYTVATSKRFVVLIDGALTLIDNTPAVAVSPAQFVIKVSLSKLFPGGLLAQAEVLYDIPETSAGTAGQRLVASAFIASSSSFDIPPSDNHTIDFQAAKNAAGDTLQSLYSLSGVL